jgi:hypothetical protein
MWIDITPAKVVLIILAIVIAQLYRSNKKRFDKMVRRAAVSAYVRLRRSFISGYLDRAEISALERIEFYFGAKRGFITQMKRCALCSFIIIGSFGIFVSVMSIPDYIRTTDKLNSASIKFLSDWNPIMTLSSQSFVPILPPKQEVGELLDSFDSEIDQAVSRLLKADNGPGLRHGDGSVALAIATKFNSDFIAQIRSNKEYMYRSIFTIFIREIFLPLISYFLTSTVGLWLSLIVSLKILRFLVSSPIPSIAKLPSIIGLIIIDATIASGSIIAALVVLGVLYTFFVSGYLSILFIENMRDSISLFWIFDLSIISESVSFSIARAEEELSLALGENRFDRQEIIVFLISIYYSVSSFCWET